MSKDKHIQFCTLHLCNGKDIPITRHPDKPPCFAFLKNEVLLHNIYKKNGVSVKKANLFSISYKPLIIPEFQALARRYYSYLLRVPSIYQQVYVDDTIDTLLDDGINLCTSLSGAGIVGIFSLFRYIEEYPLMVLTWAAFCSHIEPDKALYLAHFVTSRTENTVRKTTKIPTQYLARPLNHSVIRVGDGIKKGGHKFLSYGLDIATKLPAFSTIHRYGEMQRLFSYYDGEDVYPYKGKLTLFDDKNIIDLANSL